MEFCKAFNAQTQDKKGYVIPVVITVYADRSFSFVTKTPPTPDLLKKALNLEKGSGEPNRKKVGKVTQKQIEDIAKMKMPDLNTTSLEAAMQHGRGHGQEHGIGYREVIEVRRVEGSGNPGTVSPEV